MLRLGVFATVRGWLLARPDRQELFQSRDDALAAATRAAHVAHWQGAEAEIVAQDAPGGYLRVIDAAARIPWSPRG